VIRVSSSASLAHKVRAYFSQFVATTYVALHIGLYVAYSLTQCNFSRTSPCWMV